MMNRSVPAAFQAWLKRRPGGVPGLIATVCLSAAALMALTQAMGRQWRPRRGSSAGGEVLYRSTGDAERRAAEDGWRIDVSKMLAEILSRVPDDANASGPGTE